MSSLILPLGTSHSTNLHCWTGNYWNDIWYFPQHYQIWYLRAGRGKLTFARQTVELQTGDMYFVCPGQFNKGGPASGHHWSVALLTIDVTYFHAMLARMNKPVQMVSTFADQLRQNRVPNRYLAEELEKLIQQVYATQQVSARTHSVAQFLQLFLSAFSEISTQYLAKSQSNIDRSITYLQQHYTNFIRLDELAQQACLSKHRFIRAFTVHTGLTPHQFQVQLRLNAARSLLHQQRSIGDVAFYLGFTDMAHFSNTFKRYTQLSPKQYQQRVGYLAVP